MLGTEISTRRLSHALILLAAAAAAPALAVTDEEIFRDFRFNLSNPGARSLGLGGAFIAVTDDATAALANPAGLMLLARPELFTEIRNVQTDDSDLRDEPVQLEILGPPSIQVGTVSTSTRPRSVLSPSFLSYVHPWERFALGFSRVEVNKSSNVTNNLFLLDFDPNTAGDELLFGGSGRIETDLAVWNLSGAVKVGETLSVGATVAIGTLNLKSGVSNFIVDDPNNPIFIDPNSFIPPPPTPITMYETAIDDTDTDVSFNLGVHWRPHPRVSVGAVYRGGHEFEVQERILNDQVVAHPFMFGFTPSDPNLLGSPLTTSFNTPDSYGAGVSWRPVGTLTVSFDWIHIEYEDLLDGFQPGMNVLTLFGLVGDPNTGFFLIPVVTDPEAFTFTVEDADEVHFGAEYVFSLGTTPWAIRGGVFTDHNSKLFADFDTRSAQPFFSDNRTFPERETETHFTLGTGVVLKERIQIDVAADISDIAKEYVLSTIFRF